MTVQHVGKRTLYHLFILGFGFVMIYPLIWMVTSSFKENSEIFTNAHTLIPKNPTFDNFVAGWQGIGNIHFSTFFITSLLIAVVGTVLSVVASTLVAYGFARIKFRFRNFWFAVMLSTMMLPVQVILIPQFILFHHLGMTESYLPLILPHTAGRVFFIFLIMQFIDAIPKELDEAAYIDGCSKYQVFTRITVPLIIPAVVASTVFSFIWIWEDFFAPLMYLDTPSRYTVPLALRMFNDATSASNWGSTLAMSTLSLIPVFILFAFFQKYLVEGIATTGLKG
jgi:multiple sugar transport system permease protein